MKSLAYIFLIREGPIPGWDDIVDFTRGGSLLPSVDSSPGFSISAVILASISLIWARNKAVFSWCSSSSRASARLPNS